MQPVSELLSYAKRNISDAEQEIARDFISGKTQGAYLIGKNEVSESLIGRFPVTGIIDDRAAPGTLWKNVPAVKSSQLGKEASVINCSFSISPLSVHRLLQGLGVRHIPFCVLPELYKDIPPPAFVQEFRKDAHEHRHEWEQVYALLGDGESRKVFSDITRFRLSGDYGFMKDYTIRFKDQYFDPVIKTSPEEVLVDCGGYDGDTAMEFIRRYEHYKKIYVFEPSAENFNRARNNLAPYANIELVLSGVSDTPGQLYFNASEGSASHVDGQGTERINVETLDHYIQDKVTFIKMDIEGWEAKALRGAENHIRQDHPKLTIAVYHHASDFWKIPRIVLGIRKDYAVYLRHYSEGWSETIMYFIPV